MTPCEPSYTTSRTQEAYEAETLRFHYMYEYIRTLARQKPDTLPALGASATELGPEESSIL
jgi:hypothetical protein